MALHDHRYRGYDGPLRGVHSAPLILARQGLGIVFSTRLGTLLFGLAALIPFGFALVIYTAHNLDLLLSMGAQPLPADVVGPSFFYILLVVQSVLAFLWTAFVGPSLVAPDLAHGGLSLYLSRPMTRTDYVAGRLAPIVAVQSLVTWVPGILLVLLQGSLAGWPWLRQNGYLAWALFAGSWVWILVVAPLAIALSTAFRWRPLATGALFAVFVVGKGLGGAIDETIDSRWGKLLSLEDLITNVWARLFRMTDLFGDEFPDNPLPIVACWVTLGLIVLFSLWVLHRRVRACEVSSS